MKLAPLRYVDPSGHCAGFPGSGDDDACWDTYFHTVWFLGTDFGFLDQWNLADLRNLLDWAAQGVRFTSESNTAWSDGNIRDVLQSLNRVQSALGNATETALGLVGLGILTFHKLAAGRSDAGAIGGAYYHENNRINLYLLETAHERATEVAIHEMGHAVDWHAGSGGSQWSTQEATWWMAAGWRRRWGTWSVIDAGAWAQGVRQYSQTSVVEDFADTFTWWVENVNPHSGGFSQAQRRPSPERLGALTIALGEFR